MKNVSGHKFRANLAVAKRAFILWQFSRHLAILAIAIATHADVVELVDTHALGACAARREGSSPFIRTKIRIFSKLLPLSIDIKQICRLTYKLNIKF